MLYHLGFEPSEALRTRGSSITFFAGLLIFRFTEQNAASAAGFNRTELTDLSDEVIVVTFSDFPHHRIEFSITTVSTKIHGHAKFFCLFYNQFKVFLNFAHIRQSFVHVEIERGSHGLRFAHILELDILLAEQCLKHIRNLELGTGCRPCIRMLLVLLANIFCGVDVLFPIQVAALLNRSISSNINCVVHQTHTIIGCFVLKVVPIQLAILGHKLDDLRRCVRNLDGVGFDVCYSKALTLNSVLEVDHEQGPSFSNDVILITVIPERVFKPGRGQTVHGVNRNFQSLCQISRSILISQVLSQCATQHFLGFIKILMLNSNTSLENFIEPFRVFRSEEFFCYNTARMHRGNIQQSDVTIHPRFRIYIAALTDFFTSVDRLASLECVARKDGTMVFIELCELIIIFKSHCKRKIRIRIKDLTLVTHETVIKLILRLAVVTKYNSGSQRVRRIIDRHPRHICQNLTSREVSLTSIKGCLCRNDIIVTILSNFRPKLLWHRLIPRQTKFLMVNAQINLKLLQRLLFTGKVIYIRIRHIVGFAEEAICAAVDNPCREIIKLLIRIPHQPSI